MATHKMPPELLAHFKGKKEKTESSGADRKQEEKERRKEAVKKARVRLEEKSRRLKRDEEKETGKGSN